jgi:ABC-type multidrug transport system ATPase subunit
VQVTKCQFGRLGGMGHLIAQTRHLNFSFSSSKKILHDLNLNIPQGSIYCFLGPNGAGKTTTLRLLLGLLKADQNAISIFDQQLFFNRMSILRRVGALIEEPSVYLHLTGRENLKIYRLSYSCGP